MREQPTFETFVQAAYREWAGEMSTDVDAAALVRSTHGAARRRDQHRTNVTQLRLVLVLGALVASALAAAVLVGGQSSPMPAPTATSRPSPVATPLATPRPSPAVIAGTGTASTAIGELFWTKVQGDTSNMPSGKIFETPTGYASIDVTNDGQESRLWVSPDGVEWTLAPMPVPAAGDVGHAESAGEHWTWSDTDFRLWRSEDFLAWTEVDIDALRPPGNGVEWHFGLGTDAPLQRGTTTLLPWHLWGSLILDALLGAPLAPGEVLYPNIRFEPAPAPGETDIYRAPSSDHHSSADPPRIRVGSIRVEVDGTTVSVVDASDGRMLATIDATVAAEPAEDIARDLQDVLAFSGSPRTASISGGVASPITTPPGLVHLDALDDRFVALTQDDAGTWLAASSTNGADWMPAQPTVLPSSGQLSWRFLERRASDAGAPLTANVTIDDADGHRNELWSSVDGQTWTVLGEVDAGLEAVIAPGGSGYLASGIDSRLQVSPTGAAWSVVDGIDPPGQRLSEVGGALITSATSDAVWTMETANDASRILWTFRLRPAVPSSP